MPGKNLRFVTAVTVFGIGAMSLGYGVAKAAMTLGSGYYTNLCDSGTKATYYSCNQGCDPDTGSCTSGNSGVVKYVCTGKWNQCLESESQWSNYEQVAGTGCGQTVQLSLYDKKCRREDGAWDPTCKLLGYMVWYAGDCRQGYVLTTPAPTPTKAPAPTVTPVKGSNSGSSISLLMAALSGAGATATPTPTPTVAPAPTGPVGNVCGLKCKLGIDCGAGFACVGGVCRNPACTADAGCFCQGATVSAKPVSGTKTPTTGPETWLGMGGMAGLGLLGVKLRKIGKRLW
jgi:hypothetical protein